MRAISDALQMWAKPSWKHTGERQFDRMLLNGRFWRVSIHRTLDVTFRCAPMFWQGRFRSAVEVEHLRGGHGNNLVLNLRGKWKGDRRLQPRAIR